MATDTLTFDNLRQVLEDYGREAQEVYKRKLAQGDKYASHDLINSVRWHVRNGGKAYEVQLELANYWKYVEGGAQGTETSPDGAVYRAHFPPPSAIMEWIAVKPVVPFADSRGRIPTPKQLSFLIERKILKHGIEPFPALAETVEELNEIYKPKIAEAVTKDVSAFIPIIFNSFDGRLR